MKRVVILDTWPNDTNTGNRIIMEAVEVQLAEVFPSAFTCNVPAFEYLNKGASLVRSATYAIMGGTNILVSDFRRSEWTFRVSDVPVYKGRVVLMGVGWQSYEDRPLTHRTRAILETILNKGVVHSVRDGYTERKCADHGINAINTGCPTLWQLTPDHCAGIPPTKADAALMTFTCYNADAAQDRLLFQIVKRNYKKVYCWPQMYWDLDYGRDISDGQLEFISPSLLGLDRFLRENEVDHVGTRLHGGIRVLQRRRRAIIVAIDNRGMEMGSDFGLPIVARDKVGEQLESMIQGRWQPQIRLDQKAIDRWKGQFADEAALDEAAAPAQSGIRRGLRRVVPAAVRSRVATLSAWCEVTVRASQLALGSKDSRPGQSE